MPKRKDEVGEAATPILLAWDIQSTESWPEWLDLWHAAKNLQWAESLLHIGFGVPLWRPRHDDEEYDWADRVAFYLAVADGWNDNFLLRRSPDERGEYVVGCDKDGNLIKKNQSGLRQQVAQKAFNMLCTNFFAKELGQGRDRDLLGRELVTSEKFLSAIQNFFRVETRRFSDEVKVRNLPRRRERSHNEEQAASFLLGLAGFLWTWEEPHPPSWGLDKDEVEKRLTETRARVDAAKPWMIEVLADLHRLDVLRGWVLSLDKACLAKLREIAMGARLSEFRHPVRENRPVATLDEACFVGSSAAWLIKEHELAGKERARLQAIRDAEQEQAAAARKIAKLTNGR